METMGNVEDRINELRQEIERLRPTEKRIDECIEHHKQQLQKSGCSLGDCTLELLHNIKKQYELERELQGLEERKQ